MKDKTLLYFCIFLVLISSVFAIKPTQTSAGDVGLEIEYPKLDFYEVNKLIKFEFHVYNMTDNIWLTNTSIKYCNMHIYSNNGSHIYFQNSSYDVAKGDFENSFTFTNAESYSYIYYCEHNVGYGGFISSGFMVNSNATNYVVYGGIIGDSERNATIGYSILYIGLMVIFIYLGFTLYNEKTFMFFLSFLFWYLGLLFPLFALRMYASLTYLNSKMQILIGTCYSVYLIFYTMMVIFFIIYLFILFASWVKWDKKPDWMKRGDV